MLARLANEIDQHGWISFARYMQLVLHEPGLGYYAVDRAKFGRAGDFVTAPELGKLFGRTLARQLRQIGGPVLEIGAGSGALAEALLGESACEYLILETSAERLAEGAIFVIDYGFPRHEYYHPQRAMGTLMCHYRHQAHGDPFLHPGEQDVTAHVDFSALADAARDAGLEVLGYATQAQFLVNCGITEVLGEANVESALHYAPLAAEANKLLSPAEMGELFKVLAVGRAVQRPLLGFARGDRSNAL